MTTRPDRCPKCGYPDVTVIAEMGVSAIGGSERGRCPRCRADLARAAGTPFWHRPARRRRWPPPAMGSPRPPAATPGA